MSLYLYGKLGGQIHFGSIAAEGAGWEPERALRRFLAFSPQATVILVTKHHPIPDDLKPRVRSYKEFVDSHLDVRQLAQQDLAGVILWIGVNAVSTPIPAIKGPRKGEPIIPLVNDANNTAPLVHLVNDWMDRDPHNNQPTFLHPDMRYHLKARDFKWPLRKPILSQFNFEFNRKLYNWGDTTVPDRVPSDAPFVKTEFDGVYETSDEYQYSGLETLAAPDVYHAANNGSRSGTVLIANKINRAPERDALVAALAGEVVHFGAGWKDTYGLDVDHLYERLSGFKSAILPTSSGTGWRAGAATLKFWEYVKCGVVPIAAPGYDSQHHLPFPIGCRAKDVDHLRRIIAQVEAIDEDTIADWQAKTIAEMTRRQDLILELMA